MPWPVTIENDSLSMQVWPMLGGKVSSLIDKADKFELLFNYPAELPIQQCQYDLPYTNGWYAGWDECFPAVAPSKYLGHPYDGISVPDHGELWGLPTTAVPTKDGITTVWAGLRFGYRLTRKLYLLGPAVVADYTLVNLAPFPFYFVWAQHPLMSMASGVELELASSPAFRWDHDAAGGEAQRTFNWPILHDGVDLSKLDKLPAGKGWKIFSAAPIASPMIVRYPQRRRQVRMDFASEDGVAAYWGIWLNTGGWEGQRHFAIEATTGRFDQIDRSIKDSSAGVTPPMGKLQWSMRWEVGRAARVPHGVARL